MRPCAEFPVSNMRIELSECVISQTILHLIGSLISHNGCLHALANFANLYTISLSNCADESGRQQNAVYIARINGKEEQSK